MVAVVCLYLGGLLVQNLGAIPFGSSLAAIYPRFGGLDQTSLLAAWQDIEGNYVLRGVPASLGTQAGEAALVQALDSTYHDRFSAYFTKSQYQQFTAAVNQDRSGSIGIALEERCAGATLCPSDQSPTELAVEDVLHGQPAEHAGLRDGDVLVAVGGTQVSSLGSLNQQIDAVSGLIDGRRGHPGDPHRRSRGRAALLHRDPGQSPDPHRRQPDVRHRARPPGHQLRRGHRARTRSPSSSAGSRPVPPRWSWTCAATAVATSARR